MPTLYVGNVPPELYEALWDRAREHGKSISAEVLALLAENVPTAKELASRRELVNQARRIRTRQPGARGSFPGSEVMQREDRRRSTPVSSTPVGNGR
jgi:plasmid stability protein